MRYGMRKPQTGIENNKIFTPQQKTFLKEWTKTELKNIFRLTGGTALSAFYLEHRLSEDLDFFSFEKVPFYLPEEFLKTIDFIENITYITRFDRNIFNLYLKDETFLKVEFTYFPLKNIEETIWVDNLPIDSFLDIVINKLCAISDRIEVKDYVDVYWALKNNKLVLEELMNFAERKCGIKGIPYILKNRLLQIPEGIENLLLKIDVTRQEIKNFFEQLVKEIIVKEIGGSVK